MTYVEISNANVYYEEIGVGEPIIFLHTKKPKHILVK